MSFFHSLLQTRGLNQHDGRPLWKYMMTNEEFGRFHKQLQNFSQLHITPVDATLYYAEWWRRNYNGGSPSKLEVYNSVGGNFRFYISSKEFFKLAKKGARILGIKWITRQNTLYFRTLLQQGGLPLSHISENHGSYERFLLAVLEEQPETLEDFIFKPEITGLLPITSQNDIIYESCFEIVKAILNKEDSYDDLFKEDENLKQISNKLKVKGQSLVRKQRQSKPKNYWLLKFRKDASKISLRVGLAPTYSAESLSNVLGFELEEKEYQFYINEELICVFRQKLNGSYKTDWYQQQNQLWNGEDSLPESYVISNGKKILVSDFIQTVPNLFEPSLWVKFSDNEWRLVKGNGTPNKEAAVLYPKDWECNANVEEVRLYNSDLSWSIFEGEISLIKDLEKRKYLSDVKSFDWTIVSHKPSWIKKANMPVVRSKPEVLIYDEDGKRISTGVRIWVKRNKSYEPWEELNRVNFVAKGCNELKIEVNDLVSNDYFFNIGDLKVSFEEQSINAVNMMVLNNEFSHFKLYETDLVKIEESNNFFKLELDVSQLKIPTGIKASLGYSNRKKLHFQMKSPFEGMAITDNEGKILKEEEPLTLSQLYGLRILSTPHYDTILRMSNNLKRDVVISKVIKSSSQPLISFKEEIMRLFCLADAMDFQNMVNIELIENGQKKTYEIIGFTDTLNVSLQKENMFRPYKSAEDLDLFAIPMNCNSEQVELIPMVENGSFYSIPNTEFTKQFIVISSSDNEEQIMPRFVNLDENFDLTDKEERVKIYHAKLKESDYEGEIWKQLLVYFNICLENKIPFSTFDQIRAISRSPEIAARAFFFLGVNKSETDVFIQDIIPELEKDLGFCFHWIDRDNWEGGLNSLVDLYGVQYIDSIFKLLRTYMEENGLDELIKFITQKRFLGDSVYQMHIRDLRAELGERVLEELPWATPKITKEYNIPISNNRAVKLLLRAPIAVAESISNVETDYSIWGGDTHRGDIRRNIQYSQYLNKDFYKKVILHVLKARNNEF